MINGGRSVTQTAIAIDEEFGTSIDASNVKRIYIEFRKKVGDKDPLPKDTLKL